MNRETELERLARQYEVEGYAVVVRPDPNGPAEFAEFGADLLATRGNETVLVRVKQTRAEVAADPRVLSEAAAVNARPGWWYDLVVLEKGTPAQRAAENGREPTDEQFRGMLDRARVAKGASLNEMALTSAWAALEAAMRRLRDDAELYGRTTSNELLGTLYGSGFLSRAEFDRAKEAWKIRTQAVHGFVPPDIDTSLIDDVLALAEKLKGSETMQASPVAG